MAVNADAAVRHVVKPRDQLAERALAAAGRADDGDGLARRDGQRHVVQNLRIVLIGEADVANLDLAMHVREWLCVRRVLQLRLGAHDLKEPGEARRAVGVQLREIRELPDGVHEGRDIERERQKIDGVHPAGHDECAAHGHDRDGQGAHEKLHDAHENAHFLVEHLLGGLVDIVGMAEFILLDPLVCKGLGRAHAGQGRFNVRVDRAGLFLDAGRGFAHGLAAGEDHRDKYRQQQRHHERQPPLDCRHDNERADDGHGGDKQILRPVVGKLGDLKQVGRHPAHELAGAVAIEKFKAEILNMAEQGGADIGLHADAERVPPVGDDEIQHRPQRVGGEDDPHEQEERAERILRQQRPHGVARDNRIGQIDQRDHQRTDHIQKKQAAVRLEKGKKDEKAGLAPALFGRHDRYSVSLFWCYYIGCSGEKQAVARAGFF